jgi:elongation factor G
MDAPVQTPLLSIAIMPTTGDSARKLGRGLAWLMGEDPTIAIKSDPLTGEVVVFALGEQHLEIIIDRLKREFEVEASVGPPRVAYRETITRHADGEMKYVVAADGRHHYGHVKLDVHPGERGSGIVFENSVIGGAIPQRFIDSIEQGIRAGLERGVLAGYPCDDIRVVVCDGSYHDVDSSDAAFRTAAGLALEQALKRARPTLLQPMMRVEVNAPREYLPAIIADLTGRSARICGGQERDGAVVLTARAPLAELFGYATALRAQTRGRGAHTLRFDGYEPCDRLDGLGGDRDALVGAPLNRPPTRNASSIALPEPDPEPNGDDPDDLDSVAGR